MIFKNVSLISLLLSVILLNSPAFSMNLDETISYPKQKSFPKEKNSFEQEIKIFEEMAEHGNAIVQLYVASLYHTQCYNGCSYECLKGYVEKIHKWCQKAALSGNEKAICWKDLPKNLESIECYKNTFIFSKEIKKNYKEVIVFLEKLGERGSGEALCKLGYHYRFGEKVEQNFQKAEEYFLKATIKENKEAMSHLGSLYRYGGNPKLFYFEDEIQPKNIQSIKKNIKASIEWYTKAAGEGDIDALYQLGDIYLFEEEVKDINTSIKWYRKAAQNGDVIAQKQLCYVLAYYGTKQDLVEIKEWAKKVSNLSSEHEKSILHEIGKIYLGKQDINTAIEYFTEAANAGNTKTQKELYYIYYKGKYDVEQNLQEAEKWATKLVLARSKKGQTFLEQIKEEKEKLSLKNSDTN